ncbi:Nodulation receptor kinase [Platanthera zijinensis]|uniref:Nodulation receptor kinase n=1 Tax=Platanthera zijinensis TaxID=2320716 RepID=A0AAP0AYR1_9ASPA
MTILHFDIKSQNILLDHKFSPKFFDFGFAKLYPKGQNLVSLSIVRAMILFIPSKLVSSSFRLISHKSNFIVSGYCCSKWRPDEGMSTITPAV